MALWKKNEVKVDMASFMHYIRGIKKVGKTTLFYDIIKTKFNGNMEKGLLISIGDEDGYKTLEGLSVAVAEDWNALNEIVDELVNNKKDNNFEFIALDTVDELFNIGIEEVLRIHKKKTGSKVDTINSALGGYGAGRDKLKELVRDQIARLKKAGYGIFAIGHTKLRSVKEKGSGEEYQQLTTSLNFDYDSVIADKADVVATISIDKDINTENKTIEGVTRWIHFRDDNFNVDCGARFGDIVSKVELSAENYIQAIEEAIRNAAKGKSDKEIEKMKKQEIAEREQRADEFIKKEKSIDITRNEELTEIIKTKFSGASTDTKEKIKAIMDKFGIESMKNVDTNPTEALEKIAELL